MTGTVRASSSSGMMTPDGKYLPSHLSPSQLTLYALCPQMYRERYVLNLFPPPQPERLFGVAVHAGLEAQFKGQDDEAAFLKTWRELSSPLDVAVYPGLAALRVRGLEALEQVRALKLEGESEKHIVVIAPDFRIPIIGYADLWDRGGATIYDFKTCAFGWTQSQADRQVFQPAIYSQAFSDDHGVIPQFKFVAIPRIPAPLQVRDATRSGKQIEDAFAQALKIHLAIEAQQWDCTCKGRYHLFSNDFDQVTI